MRCKDYFPAQNCFEYLTFLKHRFAAGTSRFALNDPQYHLTNVPQGWSKTDVYTGAFGL